jgi:hypothetical protein
MTLEVRSPAIQLIYSSGLDTEKLDDSTIAALHDLGQDMEEVASPFVRHVEWNMEQAPIQLTRGRE